ncbi:hypothetical protein Pcinc_037022 [Petrolisthes cinctipes]|uniref:Uncharacterized protein n=1 Tax=Petrolisthes cinctipes TaxID=88211 RepID=A0AAE1BUE2_PETCI|nr:hypothetical protein Pcinc_037022 [Petrolisthes cinctipes]
MPSPFPTPHLLNPHAIPPSPPPTRIPSTSHIPAIPLLPTTTTQIHSPSHIISPVTLMHLAARRRSHSHPSCNPTSLPSCNPTSPIMQPHLSPIMQPHLSPIMHPSFFTIIT